MENTQMTTMFEEMENNGFEIVTYMLPDYEKAILTLLREKNVRVNRKNEDCSLDGKNGEIEVQLMCFVNPHLEIDQIKKFPKIKVWGTPKTHENWMERFELELDMEKVAYLQELHKLEDRRNDWIERIKETDDNTNIIIYAKTITEYENRIMEHRTNWRYHEIMKGKKVE
jgi:recombinational DNA repair ATPase RecF